MNQNSQEQKEANRRSGPDRRTNTTWATEVLRGDHQRIHDLFDDYNATAGVERRAEIRDLALVEIRVHRALVEEILLPAVREASGDPEALAEIQEELEGWEQTLERVERLPLEDPSSEAAWRVLTTAINEHIEKGDRGLIEVAAALPLDYVAMGLRMIELRRQIMAEQPTFQWDPANDLSGS